MARLRKVRKLNVAQRVLSRLKASSVAVGLNARYRLILAGILDSIWYAPLIDSITEGDNVLESFTRTSIATVTDFEGLVKDIHAEEARFKDARRIENITKHIRDYVFNTGGWTTRSEPEPDVIRIVSTFAAQNSYKDLEIGGAPVSIPVGGETVYAVDVRKIPGVDLPLTVQLITGNFGSYSADFVGDITEEWQRFSFGVATNDTVPDTYECGIRYNVNVIGQGFEVRNPQLEVVSGQANQNPSEFISVSIGTEAESCQDPSFDNEVTVGSNATWQPGTFGSGLVTGNKITGGYQVVCTGSGSASDYIQYLDVFDHNKYNGEKICKEGRLYAISLTIANSYLNTMTGSSVINAFAGYADTGEQIWQQSDGDGTFTVIRRAAATAPGVVESSFWLQPVASGILGDDFGYDIVDVSVKEINHGSNIDGVYYSDKLNYTTVNSNIVSTLPAPTGAEVQQIVDPTMSVAAAHPLSDNSADWNNGAGTPYVDGTKLILESGVITSKFLPEALKYYRVQYEVVGANIAFLSFGGTSTGFPLTIGSHDVILRVNNSTGAVIVGSGTGSAVDNVYITPLTHIPDDILDKLLVETVSTNITPNSEDLTAWNLEGGGGTVTITADDAVSPRGDVTMDKVTNLGANGVAGIYYFSGGGIGNNVQLGTSFWIKPTTVTGTIKVISTSGADGEWTIDLTKLTAGKTELMTKYHPAVTEVNPWKTTAAGIQGWKLYSPDGNKTFHAWGFQHASSGVVSSYVATTASTATRQSDVVKYEFPDELKKDDLDYTIEYEVNLERDGIDGVANQAVFDLYLDGNNRVYSFIAGANGNVYFAAIHNGASVSLGSTSPLTKGRHKVVMRYSQENPFSMNLWVDGVKQSQINQAQLLKWNGTGHVYRVGSQYNNVGQVDASVGYVRLYDGAKTDAECLEASTL